MCLFLLLRENQGWYCISVQFLSVQFCTVLHWSEPMVWAHPLWLFGCESVSVGTKRLLVQACISIIIGSEPCPLWAWSAAGRTADEATRRDGGGGDPWCLAAWRGMGGTVWVKGNDVRGYSDSRPMIWDTGGGIDTRPQRLFIKGPKGFLYKATKCGDWWDLPGRAETQIYR